MQWESPPEAGPSEDPRLSGSSLGSPCCVVTHAVASKAFWVQHDSAFRGRHQVAGQCLKNRSHGLQRVVAGNPCMLMVVFRLVEPVASPRNATGSEPGGTDFVVYVVPEDAVTSIVWPERGRVRLHEDFRVDNNASLVPEHPCGTLPERGVSGRA